MQAIHLHKKYTTQQGQLTVLEDVSFEVATGEFVCLVGPSGCGKSTLLRLLSGLLLPDRGEVRLHGEPLTSPSPDIGLVFQKANLMPWRTVFDNILLPLQVQHVPFEEAKRRVTHVLDLVGLNDFAHSYPHELSGGMEQRVAIARALVYEPQVLLLDEPFGALDALSRERLNQELLRVWATPSHKTIIMVTHDINEAVFLADRVLVLSQRPAMLTTIIPITLPRPRHPSLLYKPEFSLLAGKVRQAIR